MMSSQVQQMLLLDSVNANEAGMDSDRAPAAEQLITHAEAAQSAFCYVSYVDVCWCCPSCLDRRDEAQRGKSKSPRKLRSQLSCAENGDLLCCHGLPMVGTKWLCHVCTKRYGIVEMSQPNANSFVTSQLYLLNNGVRLNVF